LEGKSIRRKDSTYIRKESCLTLQETSFRTQWDVRFNASDSAKMSGPAALVCGSY